MNMKTLILGFTSFLLSNAFPTLSKQINHERTITTDNCTVTVTATENNMIFKSFQIGDINIKGNANSENPIGRIVDVAIRMRDDNSEIFLDIFRQNPLDKTEFQENLVFKLFDDCKIQDSGIYLDDTYTGGTPTKISKKHW